jgi:DNA-binding GntR family transcriptional regulator
MGKSKAEEIYIKIKQDLYDHKYSLGEIIKEKMIAEEYGVSKTPVREALALLATEGFLIKFPRKGYFLKEINYQEYFELMQFRYLVEFGTARIIIGTCTDEEIKTLFELTPEIKVTIEEFKIENRIFHLGLANLTQNRYIINALSEVFDLNIRDTSVDGFNQMKEDMHQDHRLIIHALLDRNLERVSEILQRELKRFGENSNLY